MAITTIQLVSLLLVLAGLFGALNYHYLKWPMPIGIMAIALLGAGALKLVDALAPGLGIAEVASATAMQMEFSDALLEGLLGLLLFAGALHVSLSDLRREAALVFLMASFGVALSTAIIGFGMSWMTGMPILIALVFGVLISPTDPVAVLGVLRTANIKKSLETKIAGESLFNDGFAYVGYLVLVGMAFPVIGAGDHGADLTGASLLFVQEALGGGALGAILGWLTYQIMKRIDDWSVEVMLTLGLAFGGYSLAMWLHVSAPIMAVVAGLLIGHVGMKHGMSEQTRDRVDGFWSLVDEILNAVLFLMIGLEVFAVAFSADMLTTVILSLVLALVARLAAVVVPVMMLKPFQSFDRDVVPMMTVGGIKGGISVALALALPDSEWKPLILAATYVIVVFSIIVQGLSVGKLAAKLREPDPEPVPAE